MKGFKILMMLALTFFTVSVNAQSKTTKKAATKNEMAKKHDCDMKCSDDKDHKCGGCGMDGKVDKASATGTAYACPMKCGNQLKYFCIKGGILF